MVPIEEFLGNFFLPSVYITSDDLWENYHKKFNKKITYNDYHKVLFDLKDYVQVSTNPYYHEYDFSPLLQRTGYLRMKLHSMKYNIKATQKELYILQNSSNPSFQFQQKPWLEKTLKELINTKLNVIQLLESALQKHEKEQKESEKFQTVLEEGSNK